MHNRTCSGTCRVCFHPGQRPLPPRPTPLLAPCRSSHPTYCGTNTTFPLSSALTRNLTFASCNSQSNRLDDLSRSCSRAAVTSSSVVRGLIRVMRLKTVRKRTSYSDTYFAVLTAYALAPGSNSLYGKVRVSQNHNHPTQFGCWAQGGRWRQVSRCRLYTITPFCIKAVPIHPLVYTGNASLRLPAIFCPA